MPFSIEDIPENAYTFMTNFNFNDSYIDNEELLRLCRFEETLHIEAPRVRRFSQVCKFGEDVRISRRRKSSSQLSSSSTNSLFENSQIVTDFSKLNTNSVLTDKKESPKKRKFGYGQKVYDDDGDDENINIFSYKPPNNYQKECPKESTSKDSFIFESTIDERCFNGEYIESSDILPIETTYHDTPLKSFTPIKDEVDCKQNEIPLKKEESDFWRHLSQQEF